MTRHPLGSTSGRNPGWVTCKRSLTLEAKDAAQLILAQHKAELSLQPISVQCLVPMSWLTASHLMPEAQPAMLLNSYPSSTPRARQLQRVCCGTLASARAELKSHSSITEMVTPACSFLSQRLPPCPGFAQPARQLANWQTPNKVCRSLAIVARA